MRTRFSAETVFAIRISRYRTMGRGHKSRPTWPDLRDDAGLMARFPPIWRIISAIRPPDAPSSVRSHHQGAGHERNVALRQRLHRVDKGRGAFAQSLHLTLVSFRPSQAHRPNLSALRRPVCSI
jgi:hypothetical protein